MTSRGCPWACTFCGAETHVGPRLSRAIGAVTCSTRSRGRGAPAREDDPDQGRHLHDEQKARARALPRHARAEAQLLLELRHARRPARRRAAPRDAPRRLPAALARRRERVARASSTAVDKKITPCRRSSSRPSSRKKYGIKVRYYMMLGNRGETAETFHETLAFLERAKPHQYIFSCLSIYPGTRDFDDAEKAGWLDRESLLHRRLPGAEDAVRRLRGGHAAHERVVPEEQRPARRLPRERGRVRGDPRAARGTTRRTWTARRPTFGKATSTTPSGT